MDLFSPNRKHGKQQLTSFRVHFFKYLFERQKKAQFRVSFNLEHAFFSEFLKVICFRVFFVCFFGGYVTISDRLASENFSDPDVRVM